MLYKILIYYEQRGYGGVDTHMVQLINNWPDLNNQFFILSNPDNEGLKYLETHLNNDRVKIVRIHDVFINQTKIVGRFRKLVFTIFTHIMFIRKFLICLKQISPDILISNNGGYPGGITCFSAALVGKLLKKPAIEPFLLIHHAPMVKKNIICLYADFLVWIIQILKIPVVTVSKASKIALEEKTPLKNLKVIYNGIKKAKGKAKPRNMNIEFGIEKQRKIVGMIGPIDPHKGHETILEVFNQSNMLNQNAHLLIVGSGKNPHVSMLVDKVKLYGLESCVTFTGYLSGNSTNIIAGFDILLMPTIDFEGFGYSMAEGMLTGIPVVASRVGAIPEIIEDGISGILIEPNDILCWQKNLEKLVCDRAYRISIGVSGKKRIEKEYSAKKMSQLYFDYVTKY